jgi:hypothetical protein
MNKQELIEAVIELPVDCSGSRPKIDKLTTLELIKLLKEPEKVQIPKFVANWIRKCKTFKSFAVSLSFALQPSVWEANGLSDESIEWLANAENQEIFARAWLDGYDVEKEKRYLVKLKGVFKGYEYLNFKFGRAWTFSNEEENEEYRTHHTKKELEESGFGWVFDCPGIEIEEVEE